jgi:hypothetical protein
MCHYALVVASLVYRQMQRILLGFIYYGLRHCLHKAALSRLFSGSGSFIDFCRGKAMLIMAHGFVPPKLPRRAQARAFAGEPQR